MAQPAGEHKGLVAVIAGAEIAWVEESRQGELGNLFAVAENAKFRFAAEHFTATDQADLPALVCQAVIAE